MTKDVSPLTTESVTGSDPVENFQVRLRRKIQSAGIRELPFPFESTLSITSDIDRSNRPHYFAYTRQLVGIHGLDFGDSCWLHTNWGNYAGLGFFSRHLTFHDGLRGSFLRKKHALDFHEMLSEYHKGNIDHWHSFLTRGPRVVIVTDIRPHEGGVMAYPPQTEPPPHPLFNAYVFPVTGVSVAASSSQWRAPESITVKAGKTGKHYTFKKERNADVFRFLREDLRDDRIHFYILSYDAESFTEPPEFKEIQNCFVQSSAGSEGCAVNKIYFHNFHTQMLFDRLRYLRDKCHVSMNLITKHARWHFYGDNLPSVIAINRDRMQEYPGAKESYFGRFDEPGLKFSTLADDENSFCRLFPELTEEFGVRFIRLCSGRLNEPQGLYDLLEPYQTRIKGTKFYELCTLKPPTFESYRPERIELKKKSMGLNFTERLAWVLDFVRGKPGKAPIIYTHLGNLWPTDSQAQPYFDEKALRDLQERYFNFESERRFRDRIWFARASVLSDYALNLRGIAGAVERPSQDFISIRSWTDPVLGQRFPESANQLYGMTFYTQNSAGARVQLNGKEVCELVRNPADESGRQSVTLAGCGIRHVVFDELDPVKRFRRRKNAAWRWVAGAPEEACSGSSYGVMGISKTGILSWMKRIAGKNGKKAGAAGIGIDCSGMSVEGSQHFFYSLRRSSANVCFGVLLETKTGGRFYFGDEELLNAPGNITAGYVLPKEARKVNQWERCVIPFYDLSWRGAKPGNPPLPSHSPKTITLLLRGNDHDSAAIDQIEFGRPRTTTAKNSAGKFVLGGRVRRGGKGKRLALEATDRPGEIISEQLTDEFGAFIFDPLERGAYRVSAAGGKACFVELNSDRFDILL